MQLVPYPRLRAGYFKMIFQALMVHMDEGSELMEVSVQPKTGCRRLTVLLLFSIRCGQHVGSSSDLAICFAVQGSLCVLLRKGLSTISLPQLIHSPPHITAANGRNYRLLAAGGSHRWRGMATPETCPASFVPAGRFENRSSLWRAAARTGICHG